MKKIIFAAILFGISVQAQAASAPLPAVNGEMPMALDCSDRLYLEKVKELIFTAKKNIDIAVERLALEETPGDPVKRILDQLIEAQKKGIRVRLFLNTYNQPSDEAGLFLREDMLYSLRREGVEVHFVSPNYSLKDRLMIIDGQKVLEGGMSWTKHDLEKGLGSAVLMESSELAEKKRQRLEFLPLWDVEQKENQIREGEIAIPFYLLRDIKYFPSMVSHEDGDAMKIELALLRKFFNEKTIRLPVTYEELGPEIPADRYYEKSAVTFQVIKTLERLANEYELIEILSKEPDLMKIRMILPEQIDPYVRVPANFFQENYAKELSPAAIFAYFVIVYKTQITGEAPVWLGSAYNVEQDFPLAREKFMTGVTELREKNLIEIFPFKFQEGYKTSEVLEYRYLVNRVLTLSEKLENWARLRDQFGDDDFKKAQDFAKILGEPEDPKVVAYYLQLLKNFKKEDILAFTQKVSQLPPQSTPALLNYLRTLLEHETQQNVELVS